MNFENGFWYRVAMVLVGVVFALLPMYGNSYLFPENYSGDPMLALSMMAALAGSSLFTIRKSFQKSASVLLAYFGIGTFLAIFIVGAIHNLNNAYWGFVAQLFIAIAVYVLIKAETTNRPTVLS